MKRIIGVFVGCLLALSLSAQTFKGKVTDEHDAPVPYAALYLKELKRGFSTDGNGCFQTELKQGNYTCEVSSLGYNSQTFSIRMPESGLQQSVMLTERIYNLREVNVVKGAEDPAYAVMRKAIANAPYYRTQVKGFRAGTYLKGTGKITDIPAVLRLSQGMKGETDLFVGKLFLLEEQQEVSFKAPNTWESRVKAYSNTFPEDMNVRMGVATINLYEPTVFDKISPLSTGAFTYYRFKLEGCYVENGYLVNRVKIIPKQDNPRLISGDIYIIEGLWCVSAAELTIRSGGVRMSIKINCKEVKPSVFLATSTSVACSIHVIGVKAEMSYLSAIHYLTVQADTLARIEQENAPIVRAPLCYRQLTKRQQRLQQQVEELSLKEDLTISEAYRLSKLVQKAVEASDTAYSLHKYERVAPIDQRNMKVDSLADKKDSLYWNTIRSVPLNLEERQSYVEKEKLVLRSDSLAIDSSKKVRKVMETLLLGDTYYTKDKKDWLSLYGLESIILDYNFVDGLLIGAQVEMGTHLSKSSTLRLIPSLYYAWARQSLVGKAQFILDYAPRRKGQLSLSGGVTSTDYNGESGESRFIHATASSLFGRSDVKLYEKRFASIGHHIELTNGLLFSMELSWLQRSMLQNHVSQSWFKREAEPNIPSSEAFCPMPKNELLKASFALEYTPAHYYRMIGGKKIYEESNFPTFLLRYDKAFSLNTSLVSPSFHRMEFSAKQGIEFGLFNRFLWAVNVGMFWDAQQMQFPDFKHFATTGLPVTERSFNAGFSLLGNYAYSNNSRWAQVNLSWYTPALLFNHLPFLKKRDLDEAIHLRSVWVNPKASYSEVGYSIGAYDLARIGLFVGFDRLKYRSVGVSVSIPLFTFRKDKRGL